jgi:hypothetical protein
MIDHDNLEDFRDAELYDLQHEGYYDEYPLTEQRARAGMQAAPCATRSAPRPPRRARGVEGVVSLGSQAR